MLILETYCFRNGHNELSRPPLNQLETFIKVLEFNSFSKAARALEVSAPVVSRRISALEDHMGITLFRRTTRKLYLTQAGADLAEALGDALGRVDEAVDSVLAGRERIRGELSVVVPSYFVGPRFSQVVVPEFLEHYPESGLQVRVVDEPLNYLSEPFDLLISGRLPERTLPDSQLIRRQLMKTRGAMYASPDYLEKHGRPKRPEDLAGHACLNYLTRQWRFVSPKKKVILIEPEGRLATNSTAILKAMVLQGRGVVYSLPQFFEQELAAGQVMEIMNSYTRQSHLELNILYPRQAHMPARTKAFLDILQKYFGAKKNPVGE